MFICLCLYDMTILCCNSDNAAMNDCSSEWASSI